MTNTTLPALAPQTFTFNIHAVRIVMRDGEPWFVATDIAEVLGYRDAEKAARHLPTHQKTTTPIPGSASGGNPNRTIISEGGMYRLVLRSRKPEAAAFTDWVTNEVLPSIRKTGAYAAPPALPAPEPRVLIPAPLPSFDVDEAQYRLTSAWATAMLVGRELLNVQGQRPEAIHFLVTCERDKAPVVRAMTEATA